MQSNRERNPQTRLPRGDRPLPAKWPLMFLADELGSHLGWVLLHAPIQTESRRLMFVDYRRRGLRFVGMTSFLDFPRATDRDPLDYSAICEAWCHCFRDAEVYLPAGIPRTQLALSDFTDPKAVSPDCLGPGLDDLPAFDFIYVGASASWKMGAKNWPLARKCLPILCRDLGLRGLVIGMEPGDMPRIPGLTLWPWLPYQRFLQVLARSRFLFVPSQNDPSPRVLAEALSLDVPVLVNHDILGGWHYVTPDTGIYFYGAEDVADAARRCLEGKFSPRAWYLRHWGPEAAGRRLLELLGGLDPRLRDVSRVTLRLEVHREALWNGRECGAIAARAGAR